MGSPPISVVTRLFRSLRGFVVGIFTTNSQTPSCSRSHCPSFTVLQTSRVCPVFESITVVPGRQLQVTVLAFSCLTTTQCSMSSAVGGGNWLRMGGEVAATGCFFAAQLARSRHETSQAFLIPPFRSLWPACRWQSWLHPHTKFHISGCKPVPAGECPGAGRLNRARSRVSLCYGGFIVNQRFRRRVLETLLTFFRLDWPCIRHTASRKGQ